MTTGNPKRSDSETDPKQTFEPITVIGLMSGTSGSDRTVGATIKGSQRAILQKELATKPLTRYTAIPFNAEGFDLAKTVRTVKNELECDWRIPSTSDPYTKGFAGIAPLEYIPGCSAEEASILVEAVYKQVFGNAHLMESERFPQLESAFTDGQLSVRDFVRALAKSDRYRALFLEKGNNVKAVELNFKHLLGRAPENYAEISAHVQLIVEQGYEAEIDSYLDSDEYANNFGSNFVPYFRGYETQMGQALTGYTHSYQIMRGASSSDKSIGRNVYSDLNEALLGDRQTEIEDIAGAPINLSRTEFNLLLMFAESPGQAFTRAQILNHLHGYAYDGFDRSIDAHIKNLRKKLEVDPADPQYIQTVYGIGYKFSEL